MARFLRLPSLQGTKITTGPMYEGDPTGQPTFVQSIVDYTRAPGSPSDVIPPLTSDQARVTRPDPRSRSKGKGTSSSIPQSSRQKTGSTSGISSAQKGASRKRKLAVVDSQQENDDVSIDVTEAVAHNHDVTDPRGDSSTEESSEECERDLSPRETHRASKGMSLVWFPSFL